MISEKIFARKTEDNRFQTLWEHSQNTANLCVMNNANFNIPTILIILGQIHDLGKACDAFAKKLQGKKISVEHSSSGAIWLLQQSLNENLTSNQKIVLQSMAVAVSCHHTGLVDLANGYESRLDELYNKLKKADFLQNYNEMLCNCGEVLDNIEATINSTKFSNDCNELLKNIKTALANEPKIDLNLLSFYLGMFIRFLYSSLIDADRTDARNFELRINSEEPINIKEIFQVIASYMDKNAQNYPKNELNQIRGEIYNTCVQKSNLNTGLYELNVPTGGGKTLSSFRFALGNAITNNLNKIIYVVPYISIIEQNADVIKKLLKNAGYNDLLVESHSNAVSYAEKDYDTKFDKFFTNWNEPIIFTTMVGFLESVYGGKTQNNRRFHNLANSVIIFDEVQALPLRCVGMFNLLVKFLQNIMHSTIVLCSATQPALSKLGEFSANKQVVEKLCLGESIKIINKDYPQLKRTEIIFDDNEILNKNSACEYILKKFESSQNLLVIVNTKKTAKELFLSLKNKAKCYHLSTNMCAEHRLDTINIVKEALKNNEKFILISTQLIEAGVDLDFECVIRSRCGLDSLIQSAGRCNREGKLKDEFGNKRLGKVFVVHFDNDLENLTYLEDISKGQKYLLDCKQNFTDVFDKKCIDVYFKLKYSESIKLEYKISNNESLVEYLCGNHSILNAQNKFTRLTMNFKTVADNFRVIEEKNVVSVLVPYKLGENLIKNIEKIDNLNAKKCQRYLVEVSSNKIKNYTKYDKTTGIWYVISGYDMEIGLTDDIPEFEFDGGFLL